MAKKNNLKSVRLSDEVLEYVENFEGIGFNQKFENLVFFCMKEEHQKSIQLQKLNEQIQKRLSIHNDLWKLENETFLVARELTSIQSSLKDLRQLIDKACMSARFESPDDD